MPESHCLSVLDEQHILCISREFDLSKEWNKFCTVSHFLKEYGDTDVLAFGTLWTPWWVLYHPFALEFGTPQRSAFRKTGLAPYYVIVLVQFALLSLTQASKQH